MLQLRKSKEQKHEIEPWIQQKVHREESFRKKVAIQQFMNHNGPLFRAFAKAGTSIEDMIAGEVLRAPASQAMRLAVLIASKVMDKPVETVTAADAKPFRSEAAEYVATRWSAKKSINVEQAANEIASAVTLADKTWDHDTYQDEKLSDDANLMISAVAIAGSLSRQVELYDFRRGKDEVLKCLVTRVVETASRTAHQMLPGSGKPDDIRNLTQTLARNLCSIMEACYEKKAREVVFALENKTEAEISKWYAAHSPLDDILADFEEWTVCFGAYAIAASKEMKKEKLPTENIVNKNQ